jgi:KUP system potassium uptake protein
MTEEATSVIARAVPAKPALETKKTPLLVLTLAALGVVYGDIGTSPLYAMRECFAHMPPDPVNVYGVLSLIVWSLILVVGNNYLCFIVRADNNGEGGVLAMVALLQQRGPNSQTDSVIRKKRHWLILLGIFGTALLFGDGIVTPAISVLGAVEGLKVMAPTLESYTVPLAIAILFALFMFQRHGTERVGKTFGPIILIWFLTIGALGFAEICREPHILNSVNPWYGVQFMFTHGRIGLIVLGAVFLAVTGAEALYADLGHFGKKPIRLAFFCLVLPCLLLNYFGQGALLLRDPAANVNPFYLLAPEFFHYPLLIIATLAAVVASQALISGVFSLAQQSVQLGYSPRLTILHTSEEQSGQIYVPQINWLLMIGTILVVLGFGSSSALGSAYGIAVTGTMTVTSLLFSVIARKRWGWPMWKVILLTGFFLTFDLSFLSANVLKVAHGGWVPLAIALAMVVVMTTWKRGREILGDIIKQRTLPLKQLLADIDRQSPHRVRGSAVFMTSDPQGTPLVLLHHFKHNQVLHEQVVLLSVLSTKIPKVDDAQRVTVEALPHGFYRVHASYGFMETPNVPHILSHCQNLGLVTKPDQTTYYLGRERLIPYGRSPLARWRKYIFSFMSRNARSATEYYGIPTNRVVELGAQIEF